jgi:MoaA/NifB/PqqE/SkfB family radical SAM enzyme
METTKPSFAQALLKSKTPESSEIELHLFEFCNLNCQFCGQDHNSKTGMSTILNKIEPVQMFISKNPKKKHILNIMGGEVFNDLVSDQLFEDYYQLALNVDRHAKSLGHHCIFNWVTNLVFAKTERVEALIHRLRAQGIESNLSTSYDLTGRKNILWHEDQFLKNLRHFQKDIYVVGFVLTKLAIRHLLEKSDPIFDELYASFPVYFDYYVPESRASVLMPTDDDLLKAFLFLAKNYPKVNPIKDILENAENKMTCYSLNKLTLLPDGREVKCRYMNYKENDFKHKVDYSSNENIIVGHLQENECLSCEWFSKCSFRCFVQADWSARLKTERCFLKSFFEETSRWN